MKQPFNLKNVISLRKKKAIFDDTIFGNPEIHQDSFISSRSAVIGRVIIEKDVIVAPGCSIRADEGSPFMICKGTNVQDGVTFHGLHEKFVEVDGKKYSIHIGSHCSIAHNALVHGPTKIGKKTFIGPKVEIWASEIGVHCHVGHGASVIGVKIGNNKFVPNGIIIDSQEAADQLAAVTPSQQEFNKEVVDYNKSLVVHYKERRIIRDGKP